MTRPDLSVVAEGFKMMKMMKTQPATYQRSIILAVNWANHY